MSRRRGKFAVIFVFITVFLDMVGFGLVMPVLPRLIEEVSGTDLAGASIWGGWLFFAYGGMQFLFGPAIGNLSDAVGRRPVLLLSVFGLAVDYLLTGFAPNIIWLFVGRVFAGICGASYTTANAFLADITRPEERAKVFGMMGAAFGLGFVIGPAIGGLLGSFGPRVPFFVAAGLAILNFAYGWFVLPETLAPENRRPFSLARSNPIGALKVFAQYRGVVPLSAVMFLYFLSTAVYPAIWAFWGIAAFGWTEATVGLTLAAFGLLAAIVQGGLTGPVVKWLGERNAAVFGLVTAVIALVGYGLAPGFLAVMILLVVHAPEGFVHPALTAIMSHQAPEDAQGEIQGGIASLQSIGMLLGTVLFAQVFGWFAVPGAPPAAAGYPFLLAAVMLAGTLVFFLTLREVKPVTPP
ncbi:MFS transporter [Aestuariivirga litoralis]|uniref:MFS transporter n=1 Tax=Aestuariivirga litoralis TaxID=2650924 RepID=A0A2W2CA20_9HYPH|nr:TCR/Tet family MFS transporter [Aestuariivirga litoralis]PZF77013.1 MFS transporter [Aestuariivirga litoralis]